MRGAAFLASALGMALLLGACAHPPPRVVILNDTNKTQHLFYCWNKACTEGISGNDRYLVPGAKTSDNFWNAPDTTGDVGVATNPGDVLLGCLTNPSPGQDSPATRTLRTAHLTPCAGQSPTGAKINLIDPSSSL